MDDIVVTGIGVISACGTGRENFWRNCLAGRSGIAPIRSFDTSPYRSHLGGEARDFNPKDFMPPMKYRRMSRVSRLAVAASIEAVQDAGLLVTRESAPAIGVVVGTGYGSTAQTDDFFVGMLREGPEGANPGLFPDTVPNSPASQISIYHGLKGPNVTFSHNEVSGEQALAEAASFLREDRAEVCLAGSVDELSGVLFHSYAAVQALSPQKRLHHKSVHGSTGSPRTDYGTLGINYLAVRPEPVEGRTADYDTVGEEGMRPFDRRRNGRVLGEGAGVLVLEKKSRAAARGAGIYGSLVACAATGAAVGIERYEAGAEEMGRAVKTVLQRAGVAPEEVDFISAAANSTAELDRAEAAAIRKVFAGSRSVPVTALKAQIGDFCGAAALRAAALLLSMRDGKILPTLGLEHPEFELDHVLHEPRAREVRCALLNGFSFGGANYCLLFKK